ncbi:MAG: NAD-dependent epimerase/dehydratase family protein [Alphaproteobacteria bacterium]|nr:NAD-dependent epimerase/dehydratase family protein [Alphaproteobacteria bacterium]
MANGERVLVTGAGGFIAKHCVGELLRQGYRVRGTLRRPQAGAEVAAAVGVADPGRLDFVMADLTADAGWDEAMRDCAYLMHVASPFPLGVPRSRQALLPAARDGTRRVLAAAARAGVRRTVLTSSIVAIYAVERPAGHVYAEQDWSDTDRPTLPPYPLSKTLAERAAWEFAGADRSGMQLAVINPGFVLGPALDRDVGTSAEVIRLFLSSGYPAVPRLGYPVVDVRDLAIAHVAALQQAEAAGERFICTAETLWLIDFSRILMTEFPRLRRKLPKFELPDFAVRLAAVFDRRLRATLSDLGQSRRVSSAKAERLLGVRFRPAREAVVAMARSLIELGLVKPA